VTQLINNFCYSCTCHVFSFPDLEPACVLGSIQDVTWVLLMQKDLSVSNDLVPVSFNDNEIYIQQHNDHERKITHQCFNLCE